MDDGEMPPLEGAEEDASRMEEVILIGSEMSFHLHLVLNLGMFCNSLFSRSTELTKKVVYLQYDVA